MTQQAIRTGRLTAAAFAELDAKLSRRFAWHPDDNPDQWHDYAWVGVDQDGEIILNHTLDAYGPQAVERFSIRQFKLTGTNPVPHLAAPACTGDPHS